MLRKSTKGFSLVETIIVLGIAATVAFLGVQKKYQETEEETARIAGDQLKLVGEAFRQYISSNYSALSRMRDGAAVAPGNPNADTVFCGAPAAANANLCIVNNFNNAFINNPNIPAFTSIASNFLQLGNSSQNLYGQNYTFAVRRTGGAPPFVLEGVMITNAPLAIQNTGDIRYDLAGIAIKRAGVLAGVIPPAALGAQQLRSVGGIITVDPAAYQLNNARGSYGYMVVFQAFSEFLRRDGTLPMIGNLNMNDNDIINADEISATAGQTLTLSAVGSDIIFNANNANFGGTNVTTTSGNFSSTSGNFTTTNGSFTTTNGNVTANNGTVSGRTVNAGTGGLTSAGGANITGDTNINGNLGVTGTSNLAGAVTMGNGFTTTGSGSVSNNMNIGGTATIGGDTSIGGNLNVNGQTDLRNTRITGSLDVTNNIRAGRITTNELYLGNRGNFPISVMLPFYSGRGAFLVVDNDIITKPDCATTPTAAPIAPGTVNDPFLGSFGATIAGTARIIVTPANILALGATDSSGSVPEAGVTFLAKATDNGASWTINLKTRDAEPAGDVPAGQAIAEIFCAY